jgi:ethanolamine ammonia-lyase large subunit
MRFQPGQSGNPAGRPPGARNKKTLEMEELLAEKAEAAVRNLIDRADRGEPAALRLCMERVLPTGANRPVAMELPPIDTPDDVAAATRVVMKALSVGAVSARETINLLTVIERLARLAERVQQMRERHEVWLTPSQENLRAAAREALAAVAKEAGIEDLDLYSPVNSETAAEAEPESACQFSKRGFRGGAPGGRRGGPNAGSRPVFSR